MYTVENIEDDIVLLENRVNKEKIIINKDNLPNNIKEGDILKKEQDVYIIDEKETKRIKTEIRNKFDSLLK